MIIRSARPQSNYTIISNAVVRDRRLSWKARGLLVYVLSQPDHWRTSSAHLTAISPDGMHSIRSGLKELEDAGYLRRQRRQQENGTWRHDVIIYDTPVDNPVHNPVSNPQTDDRFSDVG